MATIYKFSSQTCAPCNALAKTFEGVDLKGIRLVEVDIDENPNHEKAAGLRGVPTMIVCDINGVEVERKVGALNAIQLQHLIDRVYHM